MRFTVKNIKIGGSITIGEMSAEYSTTEAIKLANAGANIVLDVIQKAPEIMEKICDADIVEAKKSQEVKKIKWLDSLYENKPKDKVMKNKNI